MARSNSDSASGDRFNPINAIALMLIMSAAPGFKAQISVHVRQFFVKTFRVVVLAAASTDTGV
jgi:hypothetical protein